MRILFAGTPEIAVPSLSLLQEHHEVVAVLTAPDTVAGRGRSVVAPPVKQRSLELGLPVLQPARLGSEARTAIQPYRPDLLVCVAYGRIFGPKFLALFPRGGINLHPSLLPKHRGPAPIPATILSGEREGGFTVQELALEMDAGAILLQRRVLLDGRETTETLTRTAADIGAEMVLEVVDAIASGTAMPRPQDDADATYTSIIRKEEGHIDWALPAVVIERMVRAYYPWPLVFTSYHGLRLNILAATLSEAKGSAIPGMVAGVDKRAGILIQTGDGLLAVQKLQLQNKKPLDWKSFLNGVRSFPGTLLGG